jgi:leader peptidase (prepilin peptidase)/N-methyltransferase
MVSVLLFASWGVVAGIGARLLIGRLRRGAPIGSPWCEVSLSVLWATCGWWWTSGRLPVEWLPLLLGLGWLGVAAAAVDLRRHRLPDALTLPALPVALLLVVPLGPACVARALAGTAVLFAAHLAVRGVAPMSMGAGDVKLAAPLGAALGAQSWPALLVWAVLAASCTAAVALGATALEWRGRVNTPGLRGHGLGVPGGHRVVVPHGPSMLAAAWLVVAVGALGAAGATGWPA